MSKIVLLRHSHSIANQKGILAGQMPDVSLSSQGQLEAKFLAHELSNLKFHHIRMSPMQRCLETIEPWINAQTTFNPKKLIIDENLNEIDYGKWSGKRLSELSKKSQWKVVQSQPAAMTFPEGESMRGAQGRALDTFEFLRKKRGDHNYLLVTHGDIIKGILAHVLKMDFNDFQRIVIYPSSFSIIETNTHHLRVITMNSPTLEVSTSKKFSLGGEVK